MSNFKISPLIEKRSKRKKFSFPWLWLLIVIETLAAGVYIFRLHERIDYLESQFNTQSRKEQDHVYLQIFKGFRENHPPRRRIL